MQGVQAKVEAQINKGGVEGYVKEKSQLRKAFEVATGKALLSDFQKKGNEPVEGVVVPQIIPVRARGSTIELGAGEVSAISKFPYTVRSRSSIFTALEFRDRY